MSADGSSGRQNTEQIYAASGIGHQVGFGQRPGLLVVDLQNGFTDPNCQVGGDLDEVVEATAELLAVAREHGVPTAFTAVGFNPGERDASAWLRKMPGLGVLEEGTHWCEIDDRVAPRRDEPVWVKRASSAFFGTPAHIFLTTRGVDTVIIVGCVTSGCIRATAVDAISWGYRPIIPQECVGDRAQAPHETSMFDIASKYADVMPLAAVLGELSGVARTVQAS